MEFFKNIERTFNKITWNTWISFFKNDILIFVTVKIWDF